MDKCCAVPEKPVSDHWACPACGQKGKAVPRVTLEALLSPEAQARLTGAAHLFCETPTCRVVYFAPDNGSVFHKADLTVRVGIKETEPPAPLCYCFGFTREMIWEELAATGATTIPERIRAEVKAGNCRCEETNPRGGCCLGDIGRAVKAGKARWGLAERPSAPAPEPASAPLSPTEKHDCCALPAKGEATTTNRTAASGRASVMASLGAVAAGVLASSCCILPALLALVGAGSLGVGAKLAAFRPYFMGVTFAFLGGAFYFTYRKKPQAVSEDCCAVAQVDNLRYKANRTSKVTLWIVTAIALFAAFYPQMQAWRHGGGRQAYAALLASDTASAQRIAFKVVGMSCEACATGIESALMKVDGVTKAAVDFRSGKAVVEWNGERPDTTALAKAVESVEGKAVFENDAKETKADAK